MGRRQDPNGAPRTAKAGFSDFVLVCGKCAKRQGVDRKRLARALKRAFRPEPHGKGAGKGIGKLRVVETGCLGPCPKRMLTLATPQSLAHRRVVLIDPALDAIGPEALGLTLGSPVVPAESEVEPSPSGARDD